MTYTKNNCTTAYQKYATDQKLYIKVKIKIKSQFFFLNCLVSIVIVNLNFKLVQIFS